MIQLARTLSTFALVAALGSATAFAQDESEDRRDQGDQTKSAEQNPAIGAEGPSCLQLQRIDRTEVVDDDTILFHMKGGETYISELPYRCHGLGFERGFAHSTSISQICGNVDIITVLRRGNSCGLGKFYEYDESKAKAKAEQSDEDDDEDGTKPDAR